jgi:hypothetical protein
LKLILLLVRMSIDYILCNQINKLLFDSRKNGRRASWSITGSQTMLPKRL